LCKKLEEDKPTKVLMFGNKEKKRKKNNNNLH
jgi:hypothetical protein